MNNSKNNRSLRKVVTFGSIITKATFLLLIFQFNATALYAYSELVPGLTNTSRSGFAGTNITAVGPGSPHTAVTMVYSRERNNRPCFLEVTKHDINGDYDPDEGFWDQCNTTSTIEAAGFTLGTGLYVYGIQACTNNKNNQRVKGIRVYGGPIQDGVIQQVGFFDDFSRANCSVWHTAVFCPAGQVATKVRVHHTGDEMNGLSLGCRELADS